MAYTDILADCYQVPDGKIVCASVTGAVVAGCQCCHPCVTPNPAANCISPWPYAVADDLASTRACPTTVVVGSYLPAEGGNKQKWVLAHIGKPTSAICTKVNSGFPLFNTFPNVGGCDGCIDEATLGAFTFQYWNALTCYYLTEAGGLEVIFLRRSYDTNSNFFNTPRTIYYLFIFLPDGSRMAYSGTTTERYSTAALALSQAFTANWSGIAPGSASTTISFRIARNGCRHYPYCQDRRANYASWPASLQLTLTKISGPGALSGVYTLDQKFQYYYQKDDGAFVYPKFTFLLQPDSLGEISATLHLFENLSSFDRASGAEAGYSCNPFYFQYTKRMMGDFGRVGASHSCYTFTVSQ